MNMTGQIADPEVVEVAILIPNLEFIARDIGGLKGDYINQAIGWLKLAYHEREPELDSPAHERLAHINEASKNVERLLEEYNGITPREQFFMLMGAAHLNPEVSNSEAFGKWCRKNKELIDSLDFKEMINNRRA